MKKFVFAVGVLVLCARVEASVIFGNSVTGPYQAGTNVGTKSVGFLTGPSSLLLEDIQVALGGTSGGGGTLTFTLTADAAGSPGGVIATIGSGTVVGFAPTAAFTITPISPLALAANSMYWIQAVFPASGGTADWDRTDPALVPSSGLATFVRYDFNGSTSGTFNAIIVNGSIGAAAAVPEPSAFLLSATALSLLLACLRRRS
jgi:hypothetical protein